MKLNRMITRAICVGMIGTLAAATPAYAGNGQTGFAGIASLFRNRSAAANHFVGVAAIDYEDEAYYNAMRAVMAVQYQMTPEEAEAQVALAKSIQKGSPVSPYANIAISQVEDYVNIRTGASENAEPIGKIYNNAAATIVEVVKTENEGIWYRIKSGNVEGFIKSDYFLIGAAAEAKAYEIGNVRATISADSLRLRSEANTDSETVTLLTENEKYDVVSTDGEFTQLKIDDDLVGYVASEYIDIDVDFAHAISLEEERAAEEAKRRAEEALAESIAESIAASKAAEAAKRETTKAPVKETTKAAAKETTKAPAKETAKAPEKETTKAPETEPERAEEPEVEAPVANEPSGDDYVEPDVILPGGDEEPETERATEKETTKAPEKETTKAPETTTEKQTTTSAPKDTSTSSKRQDIVNYALSFVGVTPYVWGGNSLKTGVDCSGFVQQVYKHFGISLPRTSDSQGGAGKSVSSSNMKPGDLVYYGGHIAIYIGNNKVVHASNEKTGIKTSTWNYRTVLSIRNVID